MDIIVRANTEKFQEVDRMCDALLEICEERMKDKMIEMENVAEQRGIEQGIEAFVLDYTEEKFSKENIIRKLQHRFNLSAKQAEEYYEKYACVTGE